MHTQLPARARPSLRAAILATLAFACAASSLRAQDAVPPPSPQPAPAPSDPPDESPQAPLITLEHKFKAGDRFELALRKVTTSSKLPAPQRTSARILVEILEAGAEGEVTLAWTQEVPPPPDGADPAAVAIATAMNGLRIELPLSTEGDVGQIRNFADLKSRIDTTVNAYLEAQIKRGVPRERADAVRAMTAEIYADPVRMSGILATDAIQYFAMYGWAITPGREREEEMLSFIPMTGTEIPVTQRFRIVGFDTASPTVAVEGDMTVDPAILREKTIEATSQMQARAGKPFDEKTLAELRAMEFSIESRTTCRYNRESGMLERLTIIKKARTGPSTQQDAIDFRMVEYTLAPPVPAPPPAVTPRP